MKKVLSRSKEYLLYAALIALFYFPIIAHAGGASVSSGS